MRVDIGDVKGISYRIKKISCITPELEENNWNKFIQTFKGKILGNGHKIIILKNNLEYHYENLFYKSSNSGSLQLSQNIATIVGTDPYLVCIGNFKNVCGIKTSISPNLIEQYFWQPKDVASFSEKNSIHSTAAEINLVKQDYAGLRVDFNSNAVGRKITINGFYCKYCLDSKRMVYNNQCELTEEAYAKDIKVKEKTETNNVQFHDLIVEQIAPNI